MKNMNFFNTLIAGARTEKSPEVDVADRVISTLAAEGQRLEWIWDRPLMWIAAFSSAAAIPFVVLASILQQLWAGPLFEISKAISWVM